ncbi:MAG: RluA family pseudouridine synthase [Hyphomicrobiaceae bacterium]
MTTSPGRLPHIHPIDLMVADEVAGSRLDRLLAELVPELSRSRLQALIKSGAVTCAGETIGDAGRRVKPGERYRVVIPEPEPASPEAESIPLSIVAEDAHIIVVDKPAGLVVHPAAGHASGTLVNALIAHCGDSLSGIGGVRRPGIVHRLDKDTSGLLVVAKSDRAHQALSEQFQSHGADGRMQRRYLSLVWGQPLHQRGTVDAPLGRSRTSRTKVAVVHGEQGRRSVTHFEVLERFDGDDGRPLASLLQLTLETGRTHQIRVHMAHAGHPVMGDPVYATGFRTSAARLGPQSRAALHHLDRQALHAAFLSIEHPATAKPAAFESPLPPDIANLLESLRIEHRQSAKAVSRKRRI